MAKGLTAQRIWQDLRDDYGAYFGEIGHLFGLKTAGCPGKSATPI
jgi:hypothetical protein